ncbi:MAG: AEC family transporter [Candidatus Azobacteroides pseudotrichonymphae]|nr:AEC family transporter [Bacteroidales bacterium OttesenSCG-928-I14]GMO32320.1 MAG: AEC family transporter [Candidatus Azobacteroides pseudotrichonymphae]
MGSFVFSFNVVAPLFILMAVGYFSKRFKFVSEEFLHQLNRFVFNFCLPIMLFRDIMFSYEGNFSNMRLLYITVGGTICTILFSVLIIPFFVKINGQRGSMIQGIYRSNALIYGFPIVTEMYGDAVIGDVSMLMCVIIPLYNIAAVIILAIFSEDKKCKATFKSIMQNIATNPLIIGSIAGVLGGISRLKFPYAIEVSLKQLAGLATPLALFIMGGDFKIKSFQNNIIKVIIATTFRLVVIPVSIIILCISWGFSGMDLAIILSFFATPTAMASYIMAKNMNNDHDLAGQIVVLTTACSCITVFLLIYFLRIYGCL